MDIDEEGRNGDWIAKGTRFESPTSSANYISKFEYVKLNTKLVHYYTTKNAAAFEVRYHVRRKDILSDYQQSTITFKYDRQNNSWKCDTPNNFTIPHVTVSYPTDFTLARGETKDFVIKYDYAGKGTAEVTYTLKCE